MIVKYFCHSLTKNNNTLNQSIVKTFVNILTEKVVSYEWGRRFLIKHKFSPKNNVLVKKVMYMTCHIIFPKQTIGLMKISNHLFHNPKE
eukprot:TRINITY_DN1251_c0_g1_i1.p1 TRINITY_DN1251_c0_g1~~TRINITY_DN1251_c0_g1_i1.p1  ORF type:complete len:89 (-),score=0.94 TRINITY_DN1251_c0_g1_i1:370-636(-)